MILGLFYKHYEVTLQILNVFFNVWEYGDLQRHENFIYVICLQFEVVIMINKKYIFQKLSSNIYVYSKYIKILSQFILISLIFVYFWFLYY